MNYSIPTHYHADTPQKVKDILENAIHTGRRLRLFLGDTKTGRDWCEEHDNIGYIGRSGGTERVPILLNNSRSRGGGHILDHCIIKITEGGRVLYQHPKYNCGTWTYGKGEGSYWCVYHNGEIYAPQCKNEEQARHLSEYMSGKRDAK